MADPLCDSTLKTQTLLLLFTTYNLIHFSYITNPPLGQGPVLYGETHLPRQLGISNGLLIEWQMKRK